MTIAEILFAGLDWPLAVGLIALSFLSSLITAAFGIGGGILMLAVLASVLPPAAIIPVHGLVQLGSNAGRTVVFRQHIDRRALWPFLIGSTGGIVLASSVLVQIDAGLLQGIVGLFILWMLYLPVPRLMGRSAGVSGALSSLLTMFVGGTGPFVAAFVKTLALDRMRHVGTHAAMMTAQHLLKTLAFGLLGFGFSSWLGFVALLIGAGLLGTIAGRSILLRLNEAVFGRVLTAVLTLLALRLIYVGGTTLIG